MATTETGLSFVVAGSAPSALAVAADRVRAIVPATEFSGTALDLQPFLPTFEREAADHVLVLSHGTEALGLRVKAQLQMLTLETGAVLPLPAVLRRSSGLSHLIAPRGVPLMFVLDLARLDATKTLRGPWEARAAVTET